MHAGDAGAPAPAPAAAKKGPAVAAGGPDCYADPAADACRTFQQSEADSAADISQLCGANPFLVGCSLWGQCRSRAASGAYCQPFSVLGTLCLPNPTLAGCQHWAALCTTPGSAVQQCITGEAGQGKGLSARLYWLCFSANHQVPCTLTAPRGVASGAAAAPGSRC